MASPTFKGDCKMQSLFWEFMSLAKMSKNLEEVKSSCGRITSTLPYNFLYGKFIFPQTPASCTGFELISTRIFLKQNDSCSSPALKPSGILHFEKEDLHILIGPYSGTQSQITCCFLLKLPPLHRGTARGFLPSLAPALCTHHSVSNEIILNCYISWTSD